MSMISANEMNRHPRVLVIGDLSLHRSLLTRVDRTSSTDSLNLVLQDAEDRLGGAAAIAKQLASLQARVSLASVIGSDENGATLEALLRKLGVDLDLVLRDESRPTPLEESYFDSTSFVRTTPIVRVDHASREDIADVWADRLAAGIESQLIDFDMVLLCDEGQGVCVTGLLRRVIEACRDRQLKIIIKPTDTDRWATRYRGASALVPTLEEASRATGIEIQSLRDAFDAADRLRKALGLGVGIIHSDSIGSVSVSDEIGQLHYPRVAEKSRPQPESDEIFLSVLTFVLAAGGDYTSAVEWANRSAVGGLAKMESADAIWTAMQANEIASAETGSLERAVTIE